MNQHGVQSSPRDDNCVINRLQALKGLLKLIQHYVPKSASAGYCCIY